MVIGVVAVGIVSFYMLSHRDVLMAEKPNNVEKNINSSEPQFSWNVVVDKSSCDSHMCGTDLFLNYGEQQFRLGKIGGCDADVRYPNETYSNLLEHNKYSELPVENSMVTYKNCTVMGGGYLFYVMDNITEYRVIKKLYGDSDYTDGPVDPEFLFSIKK